MVAEQGLGDTIQFIRFAQTLVERGVTVGVEAQSSLTSLLATVSGVSEVLEPGQNADAYSAWLPIMSLPAMLDTTLETIPNTTPYVSVPSQGPHSGLPAGGLKVGFVWQGNPKHEADRYRSAPLNVWQPVLETIGVQFVSLQVGVDSTALTQVSTPEPIFDAAPLLTDFSATAAIISDLDLVISVDTAVGHLAGALGKPIWLIVSPANDWRWLTERADTPWYPTMRLFRAEKLRRWNDVMSEVAAALSERVSQSPDGINEGTVS